MRKNEINGGSGLLFVMFVLFLVLKLAGVITWSWWLVTLPIWICPAIIITISGISLIILVVVGIITGIYTMCHVLWDLIYTKFNGD